MLKKRELKKRLKLERNNYNALDSCIKYIYAFLCQDRDFYIYKYIKRLRYTEYYYERKNNNILYYLPYIFSKHRKNKLGRHIGIDMGELAFDEGLYIAHSSIIVGSSKIGKNCKLHGQNVIGSGVIMGDNCELWVGAKVIGPCVIADNTIIAAGAVVVKSVNEQGHTLAGVPANIIK